jgi:hypothetical protein
MADFREEHGGTAKRDITAAPEGSFKHFSTESNLTGREDRKKPKHSGSTLHSESEK